MKRKKYICDFKNDVLFKYALCDDQNPDCVYLLKLMIEDIIHIEVDQVTVINPDLNPQSLNDKDMILDIQVRTKDGKIIDVEMQNSNLYQSLYQRFQLYGSRMLVKQEKAGGNYIDLHHVYQIIFIDDIDKDNLVLMDEYVSRNKYGKVEKYSLMTRTYVYLPYINVISEHKPLSEFNKLEKLIYVFENGFKDGIIESKDEVVSIMKKKVDEFNQNELLQDMAFNRDLNRKAKATELRDVQEKAKKEGIEEGSLQERYNAVLSLFEHFYPDEDNTFLKGKSYQVYQQVFEMLLNQKSLEDIKKVI